MSADDGEDSSQRPRPIAQEAAKWLTELLDEELDPQDPKVHQRNHEFVQWVGQSVEHLRVFLETYETVRRLSALDSKHVIRVQELLAARGTDILRLHAGRGIDESSIAPVAARSASRTRPWVRPLAAAAAFAALVALGVFAWRASGTKVYSTSVGDQETIGLPDGSVVMLNTQSRLKVRFSARTREIELVRGEALFQVAHDPARPFWVQAGDAAVRAVGTEFTVRRREASTDVVVVQGVVQVTATEDAAQAENSVAPPGQSSASSALTDPARLQVAAGEEAQVMGGRVAKSVPASIDDAVAWKDRRLVFHNAPLAEIASEFNRYNQAQVIVQGSAREKRFSGIFDADHPEAIALYATQDGSLTVRPRGRDWVITTR